MHYQGDVIFRFGDSGEVREFNNVVVEYEQEHYVGSANARVFQVGKLSVQASDFVDCTFVTEIELRVQDSEPIYLEIVSGNRAPSFFRGVATFPVKTKRKDDLWG